MWSARRCFPRRVPSERGGQVLFSASEMTTRIRRRVSHSAHAPGEMASRFREAYGIYHPMPPPGIPLSASPPGLLIRSRAWWKSSPGVALPRTCSVARRSLGHLYVGRCDRLVHLRLVHAGKISGAEGARRRSGCSPHRRWAVPRPMASRITRRVDEEIPDERSHGVQERAGHRLAIAPGRRGEDGRPATPAAAKRRRAPHVSSPPPA